MRLCIAIVGVVVAGSIALAAQKPPVNVPLQFSPQGGATAVALPPAVLATPVAVTFTDERAGDDRRQLGTGTDDDDRPFPIRAMADVAPFVEGVVGQLLDGWHVRRDAAAERRLSLRLTRFQVDESNKAVGSTYTAAVHLAWVLSDATGAALVEGAAAGTASRYGRARSGANCAEVLSDALRDAVGALLADGPLQTAWRSGDTPGGAIPGPASESIEQRLLRLNELLKKGLITPEEYKVKRAEILKDA